MSGMLYLTPIGSFVVKAVKSVLHKSDKAEAKPQAVPETEVQAAQSKIKDILENVIEVPSEVGLKDGVKKIHEALLVLNAKIEKFKSLDLKPADDKISELEFVLMTNEADPQKARQAFAGLDKDADGYISLTEYIGMDVAKLDKIEGQVKAMSEAAKVVSQAAPNIINGLGDYVQPAKEDTSATIKDSLMKRVLLDIKQPPVKKMDLPGPEQMF